MRDYPYLPFRICGDMSHEDRIDLLQDIGIRGATLPQIRAMAQIILRGVPSRNPTLLAEDALRAVQSLEYHQHPDGQDGSDIFQRVDYTIDYGGNCEDLGSVLVALCTALGLPCVVLWIPQDDRNIDHVTTVIQVHGQWLQADPTVGDAMLGESAYQAIERLSPTMHPADLLFRAARPYRSRV